MARVESKTVISTPNRLETIPAPADGVQGQLGYWMSPEDLDKKVDELFPGCMKGTNFGYVIIVVVFIFVVIVVVMFEQISKQCTQLSLYLKL